MSCMYRALSVVAAAILAACAERPAPPIHYAGDSGSLALMEARAIEVAKRHPNAQPRVRPALPEQAPPPLPPGQSLPAPLSITRRAAPYADAPQPSDVRVERTVYAEAPYRYGYGYGYRRPYGFGFGWDPYGYGYYSAPRFRYGYGYNLGAPYWGPRHYRHAGFGFGHIHRPVRLHWDGGHRHWGSRDHGWRGGGHSLNIRSIRSGRHR